MTIKIELRIIEREGLGFLVSAHDDKGEICDMLGYTKEIGIENCKIRCFEWFPSSKIEFNEIEICEPLTSAQARKLCTVIQELLDQTTHPEDLLNEYFKERVWRISLTSVTSTKR